MKTFREIVDEVRHHRRARGERPRTYTRMAAECGISRVYLYRLMDGLSEPSDEVLERIIDGLRALMPKLRITDIKKSLSCIALR